MVAQVRRNDGLLLGSTQRGLISRGTHTHTQMQVTLDHSSFVALYSFLGCNCYHLVHRHYQDQLSNEVIWGNYMGATRSRLQRKLIVSEIKIKVEYYDSPTALTRTI